MADPKEKLKETLYFPTASYFSLFAKILLFFNRKKVITVTGSSGKTGTVSLLTTVLRNANIPYQFNNHINSAHGIPMSILGINTEDTLIDTKKNFVWAKRIVTTPLLLFKGIFHTDRHAKYYVFEQDSDRPGEMKLSSWVLEPYFVIWLNVGLAHPLYHEKSIEKNPNLSLIESIAKDYSFSITRMARNGIAVINIDDEMISAYRKLAKGYTLEIGKRSKYIKLEKYELDGLNTKYSIEINGDAIQKDLWMCSFNKTILAEWNGKFDVVIPNYLIPEYFYYTIASIIVFCISQNISKKSFFTSIESYKLPPGRMSIFKGINKTYLLDSTYNAADANAVIGAIELLSEFEETIAILGDMREQGSVTKQEHERVAETILKNKINRVILVGDAMSTFTYHYLVEHGFNEKNLFKFKETKLLKEELLNNNYDLIPSNAIVLIKGSQNQIFLESIVDVLLKDRSKVSELCRRGYLWDERRANIGL